MSALPAEIASAVDDAVERWERGRYVERLWRGDASLWTGSGEDQWLGWLRITQAGDRLDTLAAVTPTVLDGAVDDVVALGMGGSSLCPDVLRSSFGRLDGAPSLHVLDSTDPAQVRFVETRLRLDRTLFIVSSKSGTTLESNLLMEFFLDRVGRHVDTADVGARFVSVTDPGSQLQAVAAERRFRSCFLGVPSIGGRFSALSSFGLVPATAMGLDVPTLGAEFFPWEFATAVAGAVLQINPFDQPDVEASKLATRRLMGASGSSGSLPVERPVATDALAQVELYADTTNLRALGFDAGTETASLDLDSVLLSTSQTARIRHPTNAAGALRERRSRLL